MSIPEPFAYAIRHDYRQRKNVELKVVPVTEYVPQFYTCGCSGRSLSEGMHDDTSFS